LSEELEMDREPSGSQRSSEPEGSRSMSVKKRSLVIAGHRTSVSLEQAFWDALKEIAAEDGLSLAALAARVDARRGTANLSSALRVFALERARGSTSPIEEEVELHK
jgi:predicted DNA-binding ribbon-helix-helix protein